MKSVQMPLNLLSKSVLKISECFKMAILLVLEILKFKTFLKRTIQQSLLKKAKNGMATWQLK